MDTLGSVFLGQPQGHTQLLLIILSGSSIHVVLVLLAFDWFYGIQVSYGNWLWELPPGFQKVRQCIRTGQSLEGHGGALVRRCRDDTCIAMETLGVQIFNHGPVTM